MLLSVGVAHAQSLSSNHTDSEDHLNIEAEFDSGEDVRDDPVMEAIVDHPLIQLRPAVQANVANHVPALTRSVRMGPGPISVDGISQAPASAGEPASALVSDASMGLSTSHCWFGCGFVYSEEDDDENFDDQHQHGPWAQELSFHDSNMARFRIT